MSRATRNGASSCSLSCAERQGGFTYIGVLVAVALMGVSLVVVSEVWSKTQERQKMAQLDWVMQQYVKAIESYYYANTGSVHYYPEKLDDLLVDKRHLGVVRHIRVLYPNPLLYNNQWTTIPNPTGGIMGLQTPTPQGTKAKSFTPAENQSGKRTK